MSWCGNSGPLRVVECLNPGVRSWLRWASPEELASLHGAGALPPTEKEATVMVFACHQHAVSSGLAEEVKNGDSVALVGTDLATVTHDATCRQPAEPGDCTVCGG